MIPAAIFDLPKEKYPMKIEFLHPETREVVDTLEIEAPASGTRNAIYIPPVARIVGHSVAVRIFFGDGTVQDSGEAMPPHVQP